MMYSINPKNVEKNLVGVLAGPIINEIEKNM